MHRIYQTLPSFHSRNLTGKFPQEIYISLHSIAPIRSYCKQTERGSWRSACHLRKPVTHLQVQLITYSQFMKGHETLLSLCSISKLLVSYTSWFSLDLRKYNRCSSKGNLGATFDRGLYYYLRYNVKSLTVKEACNKNRQQAKKVWFPF